MRVTIFWGGKPPAKAADVEGVGYPFCSSVLCKLDLWGDSGGQNAVFKRSRKTAVPPCALLLKSCSSLQRRRTSFLYKYTANHSIIPLQICVSSVGITVRIIGNKTHGTLLAELKAKTCTMISQQFSSASDHPLAGKM